MIKNFLPKRYRKNRKSKYKKVPEGMYCYEFDGTTSQTWSKKYKMFLPSYGIKKCPFYSYKNRKSYCKHLHSGGGLLFDQIKECGINNDY